MANELTPWILAVVGLALTALFFLRDRSYRRCVRDWAGLLAETARKPAVDGQPFELNAAGDSELGAVAEAFSELTHKVAEAARDSSAGDDRLKRAHQSLSALRSSSIYMAGIASQDDLREAIPETLLNTFGAGRAQLWLLHRFLGERRAGGRKSDAGAPREEENSSEAVLEKVGLYGAGEMMSDETRKKFVEDSDTRFPTRAVLEAAMMQRSVVCPDVSTSDLFAGHGEALLARGLSSFASVALPLRGQTIGVIELYRDTPFDEAEARSLEVFGTVAAALIAGAWGISDSTHSRQALEIKNVELQMTNRKLERSYGKLAEADRLKGEFLANTSHELRTPLNSILGFSKLIVDGTIAENDQQLEFVAKIHESGTRLLGVINDVLDMAKIEAGKLSMELGAVELGPLFDSVKSLMEIQVSQRGNNVRLDLPEGKLPRVRADGGRFYQVLVNLVANANKFTSNGSITIKVREDQTHGFVRIGIIDTGVGIAREVQSRLFESFVQGDGSTTRKFGGTGLGLAISRRMVELAGGAIRLESEGEGKGTSVWIDLPKWSEDLEPTCIDNSEGAAPGPSKGPISPQGSAERPLIVVIEDYLVFQEYLRELLEANGWTVATARTASKGLELIQEAEPAAIVLDIHLPSDENEYTISNGYDVIKSLGQDPLMGAVPIYVVTGMALEASEYLHGQTVLLPVEVYSKPLNEKMFLSSLGRLRRKMGLPRPTAVS